MWTGTINPAQRRQLKREELLGQYVERLPMDQDLFNSDNCSLAAESLFSIPGGDIFGYVDKSNDTEMKPKEEQEAQQAKPPRPKLATTIAKLVEACVIDKVDNDVIYGSITGQVLAEINLGSERIVSNNLPTYHRSNTFIDVKQRAIDCCAIYVGRVVEADIYEMTADLIDKSIVINGISHDFEVLNYVSGVITSGIREKIYESIEDASLKIVAEAFYDTLKSSEDVYDEEIQEVKIKLLKDARNAAVHIVNSVVLTVDDMVTCVLVDAFKRLNTLNDVDDLSNIIADMEL